MSRRSSRASMSGALDAELKLECKAAYLSVFEDIRDEIRTEEDLISVLQQAGRNPTRKTIKKYWNDDVDHLTFDDFVDICRKEQPASRDDLIKAFKKIDLNGDGFISLDELYKLLTTRGEKLSREEVKTMLDEVDENGDGKLDYNEFCNMVISTAEECKKVSLKVMEKKERKKAKSAKSSAAPAEKEMGSKVSLRSQAGEKALGSQASVRSPDDSNSQMAQPNTSSEAKSMLGSRASLRDEDGRSDALSGSKVSVKDDADKNGLSGSKASLREDSRENTSSSRPSLQEGGEQTSVMGSRQSVREEGESLTGSRASVKQEIEMKSLSGSKVSVREERRVSVASSRKSVREGADAENAGENIASSKASLRAEADADRKSLRDESRRASLASSRKSVRDGAEETRRESVASSKKSVRDGAEETRRESVASSRKSVRDGAEETRRESVANSRKSVRDGAEETRRESVASSRKSVRDGAEETRRESVANSRKSVRDGAEETRRESISNSRKSVKDAADPEKVSGSRATLKAEEEEKETEKKEEEEEKVSGSQATLKAAEEGGEGLGTSRASLRSKGEDAVASSRASIRQEKLIRQDKEEAPASISGSRQSLLSVDDLPRPNPRTKKRAPVAGKVGRAAEPGNLKEWTHTKSRGCFFIDSDEGEVISHQYRLSLPMDDTLWITMQPVKIGDADVLSDTPVDTAVFIFKASRDKPGSFVACTEQRDGKGKYYMECRLDAGDYFLVPFTTGCRFKPRTNEPPSVAKLVKKKDDQIALTTKFKKALEDIFDMMDLDGNGLLSREEFNWFNVRTSGEEVADEEWEVVEENVDLENGELTKRGFVKLNEMEAVDSDGDTEDLWITLTNMGFNKSLIIDESCPFQLDIHTENCDDAELSVRSLESQREAVDAAICQLALQKGTEIKLRSSKDVSLYSYLGEARASIVADNRGFSSARVLVDCSRSKNVISSIGDLETTASVPSSAQKVVFHLLPDDERQEWTVQCSEK